MQCLPIPVALQLLRPVLAGSTRYLGTTASAAACADTCVIHVHVKLGACNIGSAFDRGSKRSPTCDEREEDTRRREIAEED